MKNIQKERCPNYTDLKNNGKLIKGKALLISSLLFMCSSCSFHASKSNTPECDSLNLAQWEDYPVGNILFEDKAPESQGSKIYKRIINNPQNYIKEQAHTVLATLYNSKQDSIVPVYNLHYTLENVEGVSAKGGENGNIYIYYSTQHIERSFANNDTTKLFFETRGVLLHELTHAYQLEPQGIGDYMSSEVFRAFIEGMADAVRAANNGFVPSDRPKGGSYMNGYRYGGFFYLWIAKNKDADFLKKFNRSTLEVIPWSFNGAIQYALGPEYNIDTLWNEYQKAMGDI